MPSCPAIFAEAVAPTPANTGTGPTTAVIVNEPPRENWKTMPPVPFHRLESNKYCMTPYS